MVFPIVLLLIVAGLQGALWYHARAVALAAAQDGARVAATESGTAASGRDAALDFLERAGGADVLPGAVVDAHRTPTTATVTVTGHALTVLTIGPDLTVRQSATRPVERISP